MKFKTAMIAVGFAMLGAAGAAEDKREKFYGMCHKTSLNDGLDEAATKGFCTCLTDAAMKDDALYK